MKQKCSRCLSYKKALVNNSSFKDYNQMIFFFFPAEIPDFCKPLDFISTAREQ